MFYGVNFHGPRDMTETRPSVPDIGTTWAMPNHFLSFTCDITQPMQLIYIVVCCSYFDGMGDTDNKTEVYFFREVQTASTHTSNMNKKIDM